MPILNSSPGSNLTAKGECDPARLLWFAADMTGVDEWLIDLQNQVQQGIIDCVAGIYVDNSANAQYATFAFESGQRLIVPPKHQAYLPVLSDGPPRIKLTSPGSTAVVTLMLSNVRFAPMLWQAAP